MFILITLITFLLYNFNNKNIQKTHERELAIHMLKVRHVCKHLLELEL